MSTLRNRVCLIGRLGQDPEVKKLESGKTLAKFSLATSERYKSENGESHEDTTWHDIVAWEGKADIAEKYMKKGDQIAVEGRISKRSYEDKNGVNKHVTEVVANEFLLLERRKQG